MNEETTNKTKEQKEDYSHITNKIKYKKIIKDGGSLKVQLSKIIESYGWIAGDPINTEMSEDRTEIKIINVRLKLCSTQKK